MNTASDDTFTDDPFDLIATTTWRECLCYQIDNEQLLAKLQTCPRYLCGPEPIGLVLTYLRQPRAAARNPEMLAQTSVLFKGTDTVLPIHTHKIGDLDTTTVASLAHNGLSYDPLLRRSIRQALDHPLEEIDRWTAFCFPQGILLLRSVGELTVEDQTPESFQRMIDDHVRVLMHTRDDLSDHARLKILGVLQDALEMIFVELSHLRAGRNPQASFNRPRINIAKANP
jgi:hypothetical protein